MSFIIVKFIAIMGTETFFWRHARPSYTKSMLSSMNYVLDRDLVIWKTSIKTYLQY